MPPSLIFAIQLCAGFAGLCWLLSVLTREYSWVDRLWSITPVVYVGWFGYQAGFTPRLVLMFALVAAWGARLTFNYARKGGYAKGGEDYRWGELRKRMSPAAFQAFNIFFVAGYQHTLLLLISLPAFVALESPQPFGPADLALGALSLACLVGETLADQQQWRFHAHKKGLLARGELADPPFCTTGFFRYSRHPNFFCEVSQWWLFYGFTVAAGAEWLNVGLIGPVLLTLLFDGSTRFTERLTLAKYPAYAAYQRRTSRLWPLPPRG